VNSSPVVIPFVKASACGNDFLLIDSMILEGDLATCGHCGADTANLQSA
jgi:hypothetical protein